MEFAAIIVAAGSGSRAGDGPAKQWRQLGGKPVLRWSVETLLQAGAQPVVVVIRRSDQALADDVLAGLTGWITVDGGASRSDSVQSGLAVIPDIAAVLVHDAARPFVTKAHVERLLAALTEADGAVPALPVADTLKRDDNGLTTVSRDGLWRAQTPQAFRLDKLKAAYAALPADAEPTDDAAVMEAAGLRVIRVAGDGRLFKLTYPEDFDMAEALVASQKIIRTGQGFDAHRFGPGDGVWLCGVKIASDLTLIGHSDADAGLHALTDAILGAIGEGDIGDHFPPTDPQWKGAASDLFLRHAADLVTAKGGRILHVDVTLICEQPKIKPHRLAMRERLADILALPLDRVSIKATTTEGMGFTGRGEGLAAQALATVEA
jgi:2-C-methyl-D-erythritol 4-phosphate cytidylyltransferase/2-C-methyl-D-erythritol 2,4-cyclodiphosphate synthase